MAQDAAWLDENFPPGSQPDYSKMVHGMGDFDDFCEGNPDPVGPYWQVEPSGEDVELDDEEDDAYDVPNPDPDPSALLTYIEVECEGCGARLERVSPVARPVLCGECRS